MGHVMTLKIVEYGPFGCRLERGTVDSMDEIPGGYDVVRVEVGDDTVVYIDPVKNMVSGKKRARN